METGIAGSMYRSAVRPSVPLIDSSKCRWCRVKSLRRRLNIDLYYLMELAETINLLKKTSVETVQGYKQCIASEGCETICPDRWQFDSGKNRGGSTSVCGQVRSPLAGGG